MHTVRFKEKTRYDSIQKQKQMKINQDTILEWNNPKKYTTSFISGIIPKHIPEIENMPIIMNKKKYAEVKRKIE